MRLQFRKIRQRFFLRKHELQPATLELLQNLYPAVNWKRVDFYEGLPWFTSFVAPYVTAQALPDFYSFSRYRIYISKIDESRGQCLADIVHESFHVLQAMHFLNGYGFGFLRGLMVYYNALFMKYGYRMNPFEIPAYDQEFRFLDYCEKHGFHAITSEMKPEALRKISKEAPLIFTGHNFKYRENCLLLFASFLFCLFVAVARPIADVVVFCIISLIPSVSTRRAEQQVHSNEYRRT